MVVRTDTPQVAQARKSMLEFLLTNQSAGLPGCATRGGECELQDMVFRYGAGESRFVEIKQHVDERHGRRWYSTTNALHSVFPLRAHLRGRNGRERAGVVNRGSGVGDRAE